MNPLKTNCVRILYIENALKNHDIRKAVCLANCFVNKYAIKL